MSENKTLVAGMVPSSFTDGPGNRMVVFLQGCNLRCIYCQNPETWDIRGLNNPLCVWMNRKDLLEIIERYSIFLSGITFSGGEALLQWKFLKKFSIEYKSSFPNKNILIDTNADVDPRFVRETVDYVDFYSPDIKAPTEKIYNKLTGGLGDFKNMISNLKYLYEQERIYEVRLPVVPKFTDSENVYNNWIKVLSKLFNSDISIRVIKFRSHGVKNPELRKSGVDGKKIAILIKMLREAGFKKIKYLE